MEGIDREHGHARAVDATLEAVEHGIVAPAAAGFDGIAKKLDNDLYDDDGKPRRTGQLLFSLAACAF